MMEAPKRAIKFAANAQYTHLFRSWLPHSADGSISPAWQSALPVFTGVAAG
jgi:hypothetical protein